MMSVHPELVDLADPLAIATCENVAGRVKVPSSKSVSHRLMNLGLLSRQAVELVDLLDAEDLQHFLGVVDRMGLGVEREESVTRLRPSSAPPPNEDVTLYCGNAGTLFRFLTATAAVIPGRWIVDGTPRLRERPIGPLVTALRQLGARIDDLGEPGFAPIRVRGGSLQGGRATLDAGASSQYLSALLMAGTCAREAVEIEVEALTSTPYVEITLQILERFGALGIEKTAAGYRVQPCDLSSGRFQAEGDYSAAAYPAAAAAICGGTVELQGLLRDSPQGDAGFLDVLSEMGARVVWSGDVVTIEGGQLRSVDVDFSEMPDQVPTLAAVAAFAKGTTRIRNVGHLRIKESDRLAAMAAELSRVGVRVEEGDDYLVIDGAWHGRSDLPTEPVSVATYDDHRIAMAMALVALRRPGVSIREPQVVQKSYPGFWRDLASLASSELTASSSTGSSPAGSPLQDP